jgi:GTPase SAR1 family protein
LQENANPGIKLILAGNKSDLQDNRVVDPEDVEKIMDDLDIDLHLECSARDGKNVEKLFVEASKMLYNEYLNLKVDKKIKHENKNVNITENNTEGDINNKVALEKTKNKENNENKCTC